MVSLHWHPGVGFKRSGVLLRPRGLSHRAVAELPAPLCSDVKPPRRRSAHAAEYGGIAAGGAFDEAEAQMVKLATSS